ncbi:hypothetical protein IEQ34_018029 [Dendrobium chrysotoxum]|uniref:Uncharacterized protein n=1 Tax=Dendrobium chrysotoxum TaxID=161865 RepID=A0AAV7FVF4_DENCH|nr:hypothetical protein IEQ34_018029 [Dendrobium chrysotoxum]
MSCFQGLFFIPEAASLVHHNFCIYHITPLGHVVAIIFKHQQTVSKSHEAQVTRLDEKINELKAQMKELEVDLTKAKMGEPLGKAADGKLKKNVVPELFRGAIYGAKELLTRRYKYWLKKNDTNIRINQISPEGSVRMVNCSFLDALSGTSPAVCFPNLKFTTFRELPSLWILEEKILALAPPLQFALVGYFPSCRPNLQSIRKFFFNLKLNRDFLVTFWLTILTISEFFCYISYFVNNYYMKLTKWYPLVEIGVESPIIPI